MFNDDVSVGTVEGRRERRNLMVACKPTLQLRLTFGLEEIRI